ncbi:hypothetical protein THAOC_13234 [Thalassiosira oceanica]|uniref:Uncharacterized protein n=1 Tax=Thalassiosira oceanica TaxID=159749 RepID=K0SLK9_THAOC|nr:hypothetical protein THAOC_13234 [Thalassiosira oceanica]|eukprot:EJK65864.1 hypothetical protein THAOC_13234 [Thalassiosira oceanica]
MQPPAGSAPLDGLDHEREWAYSTVLTRSLGLTAIGAAIHNIEALPHLVELAVFACGYAFNPIMFPTWPVLVHKLTTWRVSSGHSLDDGAGHLAVPGSDAARINVELYVASVLVTLLSTEVCKGAFATTRPRATSVNFTTRRYGRLVASLKSKHSFPSGDVAQAMNLCMFMARFVAMSLDRGLRGGGMLVLDASSICSSGHPDEDDNNDPPGRGKVHKLRWIRKHAELAYYAPSYRWHLSSSRSFFAADSRCLED